MLSQKKGEEKTKIQVWTRSEERGAIGNPGNTRPVAVTQEMEGNGLDTAPGHTAS